MIVILVIDSAAEGGLWGRRRHHGDGENSAQITGKRGVRVRGGWRALSSASPPRNPRTRVRAAPEG